MVPAATGTVGAAAPGGAAQGATGLANLMSGRSTFGGNKRRRTTSTGPSMSEAQEGKVCVLPQAVYSGANASHTHSHSQLKSDLPTKKGQKNP